MPRPLIAPRLRCAVVAWIPGRMPTGRGVPGELVNQRLATGRRDLVLIAHADNFGLVCVCDDKAGRVWQQIGREVLVHGPEVAVAPFEIAVPFLVAHEVLAAGLAFNDPDFPFGAKTHDIDTQTGTWHQFNDGHEVKAGKVSANTACQELPGLWLCLIIRHFQMGGQFDAKGKSLLDCQFIGSGLDLVLAGARHYF